jgi:hypothetical protein
MQWAHHHQEFLNFSFEEVDLCFPVVSVVVTNSNGLALLPVKVLWASGSKHGCASQSPRIAVKTPGLSHRN